MIFSKKRARNICDVPLSSKQVGHAPTPEDAARQYIEYSKLLTKVLGRSLLLPLFCGIFTLYLALLRTIPGSTNPVVTFGDFNESLYLSVLGVVAAIAIGLQVAVRSPVVDDPLEFGRREWLGSFSQILTAAAMSITIYILIQIITDASNRQEMMGEHMGALFLGFGVACICADAAVVSERISSKREYREVWNQLAIEKIENANKRIPTLSLKSRAWSRFLVRMAIWGFSPAALVVVGYFFGVQDWSRLLGLMAIALLVSVGWYYFALLTLRSIQLGNYIEVILTALFGTALGLVLILTLWVSLFDPQDDVATVIFAASVALWVVIGPGIIIFVSLLVQRRPVIYHAIYNLNCKRINRLAEGPVKSKAKAHPLAIAGVCFSPLVPVGLIVAESSRFLQPFDEKVIDINKTNKWIKFSRVLTGGFVGLVFTGATILYVLNPQWPN